MAITFNTTVTAAKTVWFKPNTGSTVDRGGINAVALFPATTAVVGDSVVFSSDRLSGATNSMKWNVLTINLATALAATSVTGVWEYCSRTTISSGVVQWNALTVITDNTNGLKTTGTNSLTFTVPNDWYNVGETIGSSSSTYQFLIRYRITAISGQTAGGITAASATAIQTTRWSIDVSGYTSGAPCTFAAIAAASVAGGWGVATNVDNSYVFNCSLTCAAGNYLDTTNELILFRNGYTFANAGVLTAGRLISGANTRYGSTFIWESDNCDYYNNSLGTSSNVLYASQFKHIFYGTGSANGTWGGGTSCTTLGVNYEGFRNLEFNNDKTKVIIDIKSMGAYYSGADGHIETPGAVVKNVTVAGGNYCIRHGATAARNNLYVHQCDFSGATSNPLNPYQSDLLTYATQDHVDCTWGAFSDTNKARWTISATPVGTNVDHKMWETYSLQASVVDGSGTAISAAQCRMVGAASGELFNLTTNPDGYIATEYGTATSGTVSVINDTGKTWTTDQWFYKEILLTSGNGAGQRRIIKKGNTATQLPFAWDCISTPAVGTKYIIIPYLRIKALSPIALTPSSTQFSVVSVNNNPCVLTLRKYGYIYSSTSMAVSAPVVSSYTMLANAYVSAAEATAAAYTGISINGATKVITLTANHTMQELYDYSQWWAAQSANMQYAEPYTTSDGKTFTSTYDLTITGVALTGTATISMAAKTLTLASGGSSTCTIVANDGTHTTINLSGIVSGSRVQLYDTNTSTELYNAVVAATTLTVPVVWTADHTIRVRVMLPSYLFYEATATLSSTGLSLIVSQSADDVYTTNGIDGSTVTEFSVTGTTIEAYINDPDNSTSIQRLYNWWCYMLFTASGIADQSNYVRAIDTTNYKFYTGLKLYNSKTNPLVVTGGYFVPSTGGTPLDCYDTAGGPIFMGYPHVVGFAYASGSALTAAEHDQLMKTLTVPKFVALK